MNWSAELEFGPIETPEGKTIRTLADARSYLLALPETEATRIAAGELLKAAEKPNQFYLHCARQTVSQAIHGHMRPEPPERKPTWKDRRKARK